MNKPPVGELRRFTTFHLRAWFSALLFFSLCFNPLPVYGARAGVTIAAAQGPGASISPELQLAMKSTAAGTRLRIVVRFISQADLASASQSTGPLQLPARQARVQVVNALKAVSAATQNSFAPFLASPVMASRVGQLRPLWIFNGAALNATPDAVRDIATRGDVESITLDHWRRRLEASVPLGLSSLLTTVQPVLLRDIAPLTQTIVLTTLGATATGEIPWGITQIHADQTWSELGIDGSGVTVATIDTGVDWQHPALQTNYRGWRANAPADHLHNWFDATDEGALYPNDLNGHGTHTMGTLAGQGGIGVAPGARWMTAKGLNGQGYGYDSWLHAAFQFILAPGGDPGFAPDVLSNSWSDTDGANSTFQDDINAIRSASIFMVFANGNNGPRAASVNSPASLPNAIGIGATDPDDEVASFSSRGPSPFGDVRPVLSAPGLKVLSSFPGGRYAIESGTSMAAPHVAGAAALVLSANPGLDITSTLYALTSTAVPLTSTLPNNDTGWGRVDAYRATLSVTNTGVIRGVVLDGVQPISSALVIAGNGSSLASALTAVDGAYAMPVMPGVYTVTASAFGYYPVDLGARIVVAAHETAADFNLISKPYGAVSGGVFDVRNHSPLTATVVSVVGTPRSSMASTGVPPSYYISLPTGVYTLEARLLGYIVQTRTIAISENVALSADFMLTPTQRIALVDSGAWYYGSADSYYRSALDTLSLPYDFYRVKHVPADTPTITDMLGYDTVIWSAPLDSPAFIGAGDVISTYLNSGRNLLISGQDIGFYDGGGFYAEQPYFSRLNAYLLADVAPSRVVVGSSNGMLTGLSLPIAGGDGANNQYLPDIIDVRHPDHGAVIARYTAGLNGSDGAAVYSQSCLNYRAAYFAYGLEAIDTTAQRSEVIHRVLNTFSAPRQTAGIELLSRDNYHTAIPIGLPGQTVTHTVRLRHTGDAGITDTMSIGISSNQWLTEISLTQATLAPCATALVTISVTIPLTASRNARDVVTLTVTSANSPTLSAAISLTSKTPAGVLLVDDDRFYDREQDYLDALAAMGNNADRWDNQWRTGIAAAPDFLLLSQYPILVWFNGYDWYDPITLGQEAMLGRYLDAGGRMFFSSQAALDYTELSAFNQRYLGVASIDFNDSTLSVAGAPDTAIGDGFAGGTLQPFPYFWNLSSAMQPVSNTQVILRGDSGQPFGLAREGVTKQKPWRTAFTPFAFEALTSTVRANLMNRIVGWLSWLGKSTFTTNEPVTNAGAPITYTLVLRADDLLPPALHDPALTNGFLTTTVSVSVPLSANLYMVSSTLLSAAEHSAGEWSGVIGAGEWLTFTFVATSSAGLSDGTALTATAFVKLDQLDVRFAREATVYINTPRLASTLSAQPLPAHWNDAVTFTLRMTNTSNVAAPEARVMNVAPTGLTLMTPTVLLDGHGVISTTANRIDWTGAIEAGSSITVTYVVSLPKLTALAPAVFYNAAIVDNGAGTVSQSALWLTPLTQVYYMPLLVHQ